MVSSPRAEIIIDGKLNEKEWQNAQVVNDFYVTVPFSLEPTPLETQTLFYSDDDGFHSIRILDVPEGKMADVIKFTYKVMNEYRAIEGYKYKIKPLLSVEEAMATL